MASRDYALRLTALAAIVGTGLTLEGCQTFRDATGASKNPPDEFTVLTKAPLVIPPDFNLRPPQPGIASRNELDPDQQAQAALFAPSAADQEAMLGTSYSDGEKLLLSRSNALTVDPNIRRTVSADNGQEDQGPGFTQKVLYEGAMAPTAQATAVPAAPATARPANSGTLYGYLFGSSQPAAAAPAAAPAPAPQVAAPAPRIAAPATTVVQAQSVPGSAPAVQPQPAREPGFFSRNFGFLSSGSDAPATPANNAVPAVAAAPPPPPALPPTPVNTAAAPPVAAASVPAAIPPSPAPALRPSNVPAAIPQPVTAANVPAPQPQRAEPKNLYQYLFGSPANAATVSATPVAAPAPAPVAQQQAPARTAAPQPEPQPPAAAQPASDDNQPWYVRVFGTRKAY